MRNGVQFKALLPADVKAFLASEASRYSSTQSSEIIRAVRERMARLGVTPGGNHPALGVVPEAATGEGLGNRAPAAADPNTAVEAAGQFHPQHQEC